MKATGWPRRTAALLLFSSIPLEAHARPAINVALKASFNSAPYLVELLETAAEENSTAYYPILDRIAGGYFDTVDGSALTDEQLHHKFLRLLREDGHISDPNALSSFEFALSIHSAAPRIAAQYQYYNTSVVPTLEDKQGEECEVWVELGGSQHCTEKTKKLSKSSAQELPFDRILGDASNPLASILYADITSPQFARPYWAVVQQAKAGKTSFRLRHKPSTTFIGEPLSVNGYGVALDLKRTDYIVIDDRQAEESSKDEDTKATESSLEDADIEDLKPLSSSELSGLGMKASSFVLDSQDPLDTLLKLTQDFPKHSSRIGSYNISEEFVKEHENNRNLALPAGYNVIWINGLQVDPRKADPFALLDQLRNERKLINGVQGLGLTAPEAIKLLSHSAFAEVTMEGEPVRFDWRDDIEGGNVIMWLNDLEKDKRYGDWAYSVAALLQPTYPGQLPQVRKDLHNVIVPVDFSDVKELQTITETLQSLIKRKIAVRWGVVPIATSEVGQQQAKVAYHLLETYGLAAFMAYLEALAAHKKVTAPTESILSAAVKDRDVRKDRVASPLQEILADSSLEERITAVKQYLKRLSLDSTGAPMFVNGVPIAQNDEWLGKLSQQVSMDLHFIQQNVFEGVIGDDEWVPLHFLATASTSRNRLVIPENERDVTILNLVETFQEPENEVDVLSLFPHVPVAANSVDDDAYMLVVGDVDSERGLRLFKGALEFRKEHDNIELVLIHNTDPSTEVSLRSARFADLAGGSSAHDTKKLLEELNRAPTSGDDALSKFWGYATPVVKSLGLQPGQNAVLLNGRLIALPETEEFSKEDFEALYSYETKKRLQPFGRAVRDLGYSEKIHSALAAAKLSALVARSTISDVPEGVFEAPPLVRMNKFEQWNTTHTVITKGNRDEAVFQILASIDPATETAQRWVPLLKTLSELSGVHLRLFLNPRPKLEELPVKRFYRYVLDSKPSFASDGSVKDLTARFTGLPSQSLLTMAMDVPTSWLVAPKESIQDLDNIKLSLVSQQTDIEATYELENILIEGHSRDVTNGMLPRGAQLVLATAKEPLYADTIIMANLGYFQFKANPGFYKIELKPGRSQEIFNIDSLSAEGYNHQADDNTTEIALMSFQGSTLFPRLSRKPGQEQADVLEDAKSTAEELLDQGSKLVDQALHKAGVHGANTGKYVSKVGSLGSKLLSKVGLHTDVAPAAKHADINIFSVASGHLYERMLNIMMVSVMKHTKHTVKFWFIEQFLSPSFKTFLPTLAKEYGFDYEMVTYKWPHWLRGQKEKQREIWGYKILFLDVLFPLDLNKVIFVDADQIVRTDMYELVTHDLKGAPYGFTPMCDSRTEMEGFRFWKQGYWKNFLQGLPYHISALYVVDLKRFRQIAAGDRLRQQYHSLSADPNSLSNLDQDLPNNMQMMLPIHSLPQEWLWCETWCSDESLKNAKTIDLCNNPQTKEPKLDRARRQVPEWTVYDEEIAALAKRSKEADETAEHTPIAEGQKPAGASKAAESASATSSSKRTGPDVNAIVSKASATYASSTSKYRAAFQTQRDAFVKSNPNPGRAAKQQIMLVANEYQQAMDGAKSTLDSAIARASELGYTASATASSVVSVASEKIATATEKAKESVSSVVGAKSSDKDEL